MHPKSPEQCLKAGFRQGWFQFNCDKWADKTISAHCDIVQRQTSTLLGSSGAAMVLQPRKEGKA